MSDVIGVDLGGTKIEAAALAAGGGLLLRRRVPTPAGDADATVRAIVGLVKHIEAELGVTVSVARWTVIVPGV